MKIIFSHKISIFLIGFLIGFNFTILYTCLHHFTNSYDASFSEKNKPIQKRNIAFHISKEETYKKWMIKENVFSADLNMDFHLYGPKFNVNKRVIESDWLKRKIHITCVIFIAKENMFKAIKSTWAKQCNKLYFFGKKKNNKILIESIIYFHVKMESSWHLLCNVFNYVWKKEQKVLEWVIFVHDDTMVITDNLRFLVAPLNFEDDYYLGHPITMWKQKYNVAQAGYVLSKSTLRKLFMKFNTSEKCVSGGKYWKMEDFYLGQNLESLKIYPSDTRDSKLRGIFHGYSLQTLMWGIARPSNYWTKALYPVGSFGCCSPLSVTFTVSEANKLYTVNYLLYHLHVYKKFGVYGNRPSPTSIPEEEVWKTVLEQEFGLKNISEISQEQYYSIWRSMYSEPEEFLARIFGTSVPDFKIRDSLKESTKNISVQMKF